ncbi:tyrosine-type recombinase/integrase [Dechloromonas denitrificans]|uniref:tyrosine-type recombinase/integrase n=1 Tax=Dechloromonas denitrificans TaxID=281362 RepID=UPI001CF84000|nr:tyrosine-type recombinase/integrase [Dechloromonas denitrificans]UCV01732.1 tyrosine-type recombinase/integrase [Dechloromonas denitrificans]
MKAAIGRQRQNNLDFPPRMHLKCGTFYYVTTRIPRKWIGLGKEINEARRRWAEIEAVPDSRNENGLASLVDDWMACETFAKLSDNTRKQYKAVAKQLKLAFQEFTSVAEIKPHHVAGWQDGHNSKVMANTGKSILTTVLNIAIRRGIIDRNPAKEVENLTVARRKRYITDEEFIAIREKATPVLRAAMDLSYVTGARIGDILDIHLSQITTEGLTIRQEKTEKLQLFKRNAALDLAIENAKAIKRPVRGLFLLCTMRGQQYDYQQLNQWWIKARNEAGIEDVHFHDIRGKSATDAKRAGIDYQALLGHTTKAMSDSYIKLDDAQIVEPLNRSL